VPALGGGAEGLQDIQTVDSTLQSELIEVVAKGHLQNLGLQGAIHKGGRPFREYQVS
jgi:hypothetical protein